MDTATFAAGCFWGIEEAFLKLPGVIDTEVGYAGGFVKNPTYEEVCEGNTGHSEAVRVTYDQEKISYQDLLNAFWRLRDPTIQTKVQYKSIVFTHNNEQYLIAKASKKEVARSLGGRILTEIKPVGPFYLAEEYHQKYLHKSK